MFSTRPYTTDLSRGRGGIFGTSCKINDFTVNYDKLIVTVGAQTNTFGIPGVREHCAFLKQVEDARRIRTSIVNLFERANIPGLSDDEREAILTFAIIGAGPTGIEFASELKGLAPRREEDIIAICDVGAYGMSLSSNYNLRPKSTELLINNSKIQVITKRQSLKDLI